MTTLDRIDYALLRLLRKNARLPNKDLAGKVGIAQSTALERVRKLREDKVLLGYHAEIAPQAIGIGLQAMVSVRLAKHSRALVDGFHAHLLALPEVLACYHVAGADDFLVHVVTRDARELRDVIVQRLLEQPAVARAESSIIFDYTEADGWKKLLDD